MLTRSQAADYLEEEQERLLQLLKDYPVVMTSLVSDLPGGHFRVVIDSPEVLDLLILQLRAETVNKEEALNPMLIR